MPTDIITASGTYALPAHVGPVIVECWSGGAGGAAAPGNYGGGGGSYAKRVFTTLAAGNYSVTIGAGGTAGVAGVNGGAPTGGGATYWADGSQVRASGNLADPSVGAPNDLGDSAGTTIMGGEDGEDSVAGAGGAGGNAANSGGAGGDGGSATENAGNGGDGEAPGGGGGGGGTNDSGAGGRGEIRVTYATGQDNIFEQVAQNVVTTLQTISTGNGYEFSPLVRRFSTVRAPTSKTIDGNEAYDIEIEVMQAQIAKAEPNVYGKDYYVMPFAAVCYVMQSKNTSVSTDAYVNLIATSVVKALMEDAHRGFYTNSNGVLTSNKLATDTRIGDINIMSKEAGHYEGAVIEFFVDVRTAENDPYNQ